MLRRAKASMMLDVYADLFNDVDLRGFEPLPVPAKIGSELGRMFDHGVTRPLCVLPICAAVLRDVTVLWPRSPASTPNGSGTVATAPTLPHGQQMTRTGNQSG